MREGTDTAAANEAVRDSFGARHPLYGLHQNDAEEFFIDAINFLRSVTLGVRFRGCYGPFLGSPTQQHIWTQFCDLSRGPVTKTFEVIC